MKNEQNIIYFKNFSTFSLTAFGLVKKLLYDKPVQIIARKKPILIETTAYAIQALTKYARIPEKM